MPLRHMIDQATVHDDADDLQQTSCGLDRRGACAHAGLEFCDWHCPANARGREDLRLAHIATHRRPGQPRKTGGRAHG